MNSPKAVGDGNGGVYIKWGWIGKAVAGSIIASVPVALTVGFYLIRTIAMLQANQVMIVEKLASLTTKVDAIQTNISAHEAWAVSERDRLERTIRVPGKADLR